MIGLIILGGFILMIIVAHISEYIHRKKVLGDLTGRYYHKKSPKGMYLYVEVILGRRKFFRRASLNDAARLKQLNLLKK